MTYNKLLSFKYSTRKTKNNNNNNNKQIKFEIVEEVKTYLNS